MKKKTQRIVISVIAVLLVIAMLLPMLTGCGSEKKVKTEVPTMPVAEGVSHEVLQAENDGAMIFGRETGFAEYLMTNMGANPLAEPLYYYDENGEAVGEYIYDENCWVHSWKDDDGNIHKLPESEQFESMDAIASGASFRMAGEVKLKFFLYVREQKPIACYRYFVLTEKADMENLLVGLAAMGLEDVEKVSENVVLHVADGGDIEIERMEEDLSESVSDYMAYIVKTFGVSRIG